MPLAQAALRRSKVRPSNVGVPAFDGLPEQGHLPVALFIW